MVASPIDVTLCWQVIEAAGIPRPWSTPEEADRSVQVWAAVLADVPAERLQACTVAWLRSPEARFRTWPMPGALLHALGTPEQVDDADDAWAEVLGLIRLRGADRCPASVAEIEDLRQRLRAGYREAREKGDAARMERYHRHGAALPREDEHRTAALLAGVAACGGWRALGRADEGTIAAHRASFRACYRGHRQRKQLTATEQQVVALLDGPSNRPALEDRRS